jgi:RNase adapter protein RapZ
VPIDCDDVRLEGRYIETPRSHPLAGDRPTVDGIRRERQMLRALHDRAALLIGITALNPAELKRLLTGHLALDTHGLRVFVTALVRAGPTWCSHPHPSLPRNPRVTPGFSADRPSPARPGGREGRPRTAARRGGRYGGREGARPGRSGCDPEVAAPRRRDADFMRSSRGLRRLLEPLLPRYEATGKTYLTIAIGGTGVRHRSVFVTERLSARLRDLGWQTGLAQRDLHPGAVGAPLAAGAFDAAMG